MMHVRAAQEEIKIRHAVRHEEQYDGACGDESDHENEQGAAGERRGLDGNRCRYRCGARLVWDNFSHDCLILREEARALTIRSTWQHKVRDGQEDVMQYARITLFVVLVTGSLFAQRGYALGDPLGLYVGGALGPSTVRVDENALGGSAGVDGDRDAW